MGLFAFALGAISVPALATDVAEKHLLLELNKVESVGGDCRTTWVVKNTTGTNLETMKLDFVAFDTDGIVVRRVIADMGPIHTEHTRVKLFDLKEINCGNVGRVLMNGVRTCEGGSAAVAPGLCADNLQTATRAAVPFTQ
ncbi:hypothetical protein [Nisaea sp.]|uniref:hypothetical protein n=1 Tax=Nisaea sp. TaxID=2024842 RepID=UPI003299EA65